jgi:hypothetical protein
MRSLWTAAGRTGVGDRPRAGSSAASVVALLVVLAAMIATVGAAEAPATPRDPFLDQLAGRWEFVGTVRGTPVRYAGEGKWVLGDGWLRLALVDAGPPPPYEANVYLGFDSHAGDYVAHWLDRFGAAGARVVATGHRDGQTLVLLFPYEGNTFRDTLTLAQDRASGSLLIESQNADRTWSTFASYTFTRKH